MLTPLWIPCNENLMADQISRAFKSGKFFVAQQNLICYFKATFHLPQNHFWQEFTAPSKLSQRVISCLLGESLTLGSLLRLPKSKKNTGRHGNATQHNGTLIRPCRSAINLTQSLSSQLLLHGSGEIITATAFKSAFQQSLKRCWLSPRPSSWLDNPVPSKNWRKHIPSQSRDSLKGTEERIHHQSHS